jgi:hypothetical protein
MLLPTDRNTRAFFTASTHFIVGNDSSFKFWTDPWVGGACIAALAPELFTTVAASRRCQRTVAQRLPNNAWVHDITALTVPILI